MIDVFIKIKEERIRRKPMSKAQREEKGTKDQSFRLKILSLFHFNILTFFSRVMYVFEATLHPNYSVNPVPAQLWTKILESARPIRDNTIRKYFFDDRGSSDQLEFSDCSINNQDKEVVCDDSWGQFIELYEEPKHVFCHVAQ
jgi:hypothetical protein